MSVRGGRTRGLRRPHPPLIRQTSGDDSETQDERTPSDPQSPYRPVLPHEPGYSEFDTPVASAIVRGEIFHTDAYTRPESPVGNPYGRPVDHMDCSTAADDAHVERQVSPAGGDDVEQGHDPHETVQPESEDITQPDSEDVAQPEAPDFPELKEREVWTIGMFRVITNDGGSTKPGWAMVPPKKNFFFFGKNRSKTNKQIKRKKQSLVLILVIWPSPKKIRALFLDCMDISNKCFWPYS
jgi:hypothetical protein